MRKIYYLVEVQLTFNNKKALKLKSHFNAVEIDRSGLYYKLDSRRIKHNPNLVSNTLRRQIPRKLTPHNAIGSMSTTNLSPIDTKFTSIGSSIRGDFGNVGNFLSEIKVGFGFGVYALDFDEGYGVVLGAEAALVA